MKYAYALIILLLYSCISIKNSPGSKVNREFENNNKIEMLKFNKKDSLKHK